MVDDIDFGRTVARFGATDAGYIVNVLRAAYQVMEMCDEFNSLSTPGKVLVLEFIDALEDCDSIELVDDEEMLVDEN
jgi:hypothetical protein